MAAPTVCSIEGCEKTAVKGRRGLCHRHYKRLWRYGDPLAGRELRASSAEIRRFLNEVVFTHSENTCLFWPYGRHSRKGYISTTIDGCRHMVHRLVCETRHGPAPSADHYALHSCGNGHLGCVSPTCLRWGTPAENCADKNIHGTHVRGQRHYHNRLTESDVWQIRSLKGKVPYVKIAEQYRVATSCISMIQCGKSWAWLK